MADRWPLTGREEELLVIGEALADDEHPGMVVAGQAGVGKTRLARAAADAAARAGWSVRRVAGTSTGRSVTLGAFAPWADDTESSPVMLARKVFTGLTAGTDGAPLLLLVDDAHHLDDLSAVILHQLVLQRVAVVVATIRTGEPVADAVRALWKDGLLARMDLQPLSRSESGALLESVLGAAVRPDCAERMYTLSGGNVLFLRHLVDHELKSGRLECVDGEWHWTGTSSVSPSLVELVEEQIGTVPDDVRDVVDLVAIAEPIGRDVLARLADPAAIESAEQRGLIVAPPATDAVYVGHPLYGEIRLGQCGSLRQSRLRGRVATAMAQSESADPLRVGLLWLESDLAPDAMVLLRAAQISGLRLDLGLAERLARAAVDASATAATKLALAYILVTRANGNEAEELLDTLSAEELAVPGLVDGVILRAANQLFLLQNPAECRAVLEEAIGLGDEARNHGLRTFLAVQQVMAAEPTQVLETMAAVDYERMDDFGRVLGYAAETIALGDLGRTQDAAHTASNGYRVLAESPLEAFHGTGLAEFDAFALLAAGHIARADAAAEREFRRCADMPGMSQPLALAAMGMTALARGDLTSALRHLNSADGALSDDDQLFISFYRFKILLTEVLARCGDVDAAVTSLDRTRRSRHPGFAYVESGYLLAQAWVHAVQGRLPEAHTFTSQAAEFARTHRQPAREVLCLQTAVQFGDVTVVDRAAELAAEVEGPRAPLVSRYARAMADDDPSAVEAVSHDFEAMGDVLAAADAAAQAATAHRRAGRRGSALTASARARALARRCGGAVSPALAAAEVPLPFTRREHEIAQLLGRGLSNKEIAQAMSLSVRTVEGHIYQASSKAGVSSRSDLAALIAQLRGLS
ncbi:LuxR family transcriptional regulator [Mycolicibacterium moriokaense]|nr:LuxR family transcriptional regulator [Mycolicibacterium moriokaense]